MISMFHNVCGEHKERNVRHSDAMLSGFLDCSLLPMLMNFDSFCTVGFWSTANVFVAHNHFPVHIQSSHALDNLQTTAQIEWKQIIFHVKIEDLLMAT